MLEKICTMMCLAKLGIKCMAKIQDMIVCNGSQAAAAANLWLKSGIKQGLDTYKVENTLEWSKHLKQKEPLEPFHLLTTGKLKAKGALVASFPWLTTCSFRWAHSRPLDKLHAAMCSAILLGWGARQMTGKFSSQDSPTVEHMREQEHTH